MNSLAKEAEQYDSFMDCYGPENKGGNWSGS